MSNDNIQWREVDYSEWVLANQHSQPKRATYGRHGVNVYELGTLPLPIDRPFVADVQTSVGVERTVIQRNPALRGSIQYTTTIEVDGQYHYDTTQITYVRDVDLT